MLGLGQHGFFEAGAAGVDFSAANVQCCFILIETTPNYCMALLPRWTRRFGVLSLYPFLDACRYPRDTSFGAFVIAAFSFLFLFPFFFQP
jgi:hypothetical protein